MSITNPIFHVIVYLFASCYIEANDQIATLISDGFGARTSDFKRQVSETLADEIVDFDSRNMQWKLLLDERTFFLAYQSKGNEIRGISIRSEIIPEEIYPAEMAEDWKLICEVYSKIAELRNEHSEIVAIDHQVPPLDEIEKADDKCSNCDGISNKRAEFIDKDFHCQITMWHYISSNRFLVPILSIWDGQNRKCLYPRL